MEYIKTFQVKGRPCRAHVVRDRCGSLWVMAEDKDGLTDWPLRYSDGRIVYDHPERFPQYAKVLVGRAFDWLDRNREENKQDGIYQ